jgi:hypothetical protein
MRRPGARRGQKLTVGTALSRARYSTQAIRQVGHIRPSSTDPQTKQTPNGPRSTPGRAASAGGFSGSLGGGTDAGGRVAGVGGEAAGAGVDTSAPGASLLSGFGVEGDGDAGVPPAGFPPSA